MEAGPAPSANRGGNAARIRQRIGDPDARDRRQRTITWVLLAAVGILLVNALIGENGYLATVQARQEEAVLTRALARVRLENQELKKERESLQHNPQAIEEAARRELGMLRPGEAVVIVQTPEAVPPHTP